MDTKPPRRTALEERNDRRFARGPVAKVLLMLALASVFAPASAESTTAQASATRASAVARLDFRIVIPKVLQLDTNAGTLSTNAHRMETIVIVAADAERHRSISSPSNGTLFRAAIDTLTREAGHPLSGYTVTMP